MHAHLWEHSAHFFKGIYSSGNGSAAGLVLQTVHTYLPNIHVSQSVMPLAVVMVLISFLVIVCRYYLHAFSPHEQHRVSVFSAFQSIYCGEHVCAAT